MDSKLCEIAQDVYRISTFHPEFGIQFNQFLIKDDEPLLMHTGLRKMPYTPYTDLNCAGLPSYNRKPWP
jgi:hypothetical protein